ncbi:BspA family leucine-rich repeat surface protein, partial [Runella defluvii]
MKQLFYLFLLSFVNGLSVSSTWATTYNWDGDIALASIHTGVVLYNNVPVGTPFITRWDLSKPGSSANQLSIDVATAGTVNYTWTTVPAGTSGSGTFSGTTLAIPDLPTNAVIDLSIDPTNFQQIHINNGGDRQRLIQIKQWGDVAWTSMYRAFYGCSNMTLTATDVPNLVGVTNMSSMFYGCTTFNQALPEGFNTSSVVDMSYLFFGCSAFNQALPSTFNTSSVTNMSAMFYGCTLFNQTLPTSFNTSSVTNMFS